MRRLIIVGFLILSYYVQGQTKLDFASVDKKTYALYQAAQWDSLVHLGKEAHRQNIDYYYLNYRMGVAYFYKNSFRKASHFLQKALAQNNAAMDDAYFREILHLALVYAQRNDLAMDVPLAHKTDYLDPLVRNKFTFYAGGGKMINFDHSKAMIKPNPTYSELNYQEAINYWAISYKHQFSSGFNMGISYSNLHFLMETIVDPQGPQISKTYKITQYNIALIPEFSLGTHWQIKPVLGFSSNKGFPFSIVDTVNGEKVFDYWSYKESNFMFGLNIYRHILNTKLGFNMGISNYSNRRQAQVGFNLTYFPFGNLNLYTHTAVSLKVDDRVADIIFQQNIGFKVFSKLWIEAGILTGELKNYNDFSLGYGYNIADDMDMNLFSKLIFVVSNTVSFTLDGQYIHKYTFRKDDYNNNERIETRIDYDQWNIEGGLIWKF